MYGQTLIVQTILKITFIYEKNGTKEASPDNRKVWIIKVSTMPHGGFLAFQRFKCINYYGTLKKKAVF